jgi:hypothetical protein
MVLYTIIAIAFTTDLTTSYWLIRIIAVTFDIQCLRLYHMVLVNIIAIAFAIKFLRLTPGPYTHLIRRQSGRRAHKDDAFDAARRPHQQHVRGGHGAVRCARVRLGGERRSDHMRRDPVV